MPLKENCPICGNACARDFLHRKNVPVHQNLVMDDHQAATHIARGDLNMAACDACGFVFNRSFDFLKLTYGGRYDNTQSHSPYFSSYLMDRVNYLLFEKKLQKGHILEIGCGKGLFLQKLIEDKDAGNTGKGFDPSYIGPDTLLDGRLTFEKAYFGPKAVDIDADAVICRHVLEHVPEPLEFLRGVRLALKSATETRIFFETPCVEWILNNHIIWDFFYEHCSLFSKDSLTTAFQSAGFHVDAVKHVFNDQYLWLEATIPSDRPEVKRSPAQIPEMAARFAINEDKMKRDWEMKVLDLSSKGKVALWGGGAKGTTFANLIDPSHKLIDCIVDLNPNKQGHHLPGTGHPIIGVGELQDRGITDAVLMNPNYRQENIALLREAEININLIE